MKHPLLAALCLAFASAAFAHQGMPHDHLPTAQATTEASSQDQMALQARRLGLPEGTIKISECVPGMGEHWGNPKDLPFGPIYGVMNGKVVFVEVMVDHNLFKNGQSWVNILKPLPGKRINHVDIEFQAQGHEGFPVPHYDIHAYFVTHEEHMNYCLPGN